MTQLRLLLFSILFLVFTSGYSQPTTKSYYVPALEGTKLAVDVHFPANYSDQKLPALIEFTRYWRSREDPKTGEPTEALRERDEFFINNEYIFRNTYTNQ